MKTKDILTIHAMLNEQGKTLQKVESDDAKFDIIMLASKMRKIADDYKELLTDASEKLKGANHDEVMSQLAKWRNEGTEALTQDERIAVNRYLADYQKKVEKCVEPEAEKEHDIDTKPLKDNMKGIILSYGWDVNTADQFIKIVES